MQATDPMMLICELAAGRFALALTEVVEVLPVVPLWRPPGLPRPLVGFAQVRGAAVAVLAPALLLGDAETVTRIALHAHLVHVKDAGGGSLCLLVDRAEDIVATKVRPVDAALSQRGCVTGEVSVGDGVAYVLAVDRLLADGARVRIAELAAEAARRADEWAA